jgi:hypothetical protein
MNYADTLLMTSSEDSGFPVFKSVSDSTAGSLSDSFAFYIQEKSGKNVEEVYLMNTTGRKCHLNNNNSEENKNYNSQILFTSSALLSKDPSLPVASTILSSVSAKFSSASSYKNVFNIK